MTRGVPNNGGPENPTLQNGKEMHEEKSKNSPLLTERILSELFS
jgi:hypothetical protein